MPEFPVTGVRIGHVTRDGSGVTVALLPAGTIGSAEVRGGAPATREFDVLDPLRTVARVDAVVFAGGSAFGLAAGDGVMRYLAERGQGFPTAAGPVPIVPTAAIFDLLEASARPTADDGYDAAVAAARGDEPASGRVGAGTGATVGKWRGRDHGVPGGVGIAATAVDGFTVAALAVVNAVGDVVDGAGAMIAGSTAPPNTPAFPTAAPFEERREHTTLVLVATDAVLDKPACALVARSGHDALARALRPSHTRHDGDLVVAVATGTTATADGPHLDRLRIAATDAVAEAVRAAPR